MRVLIQNIGVLQEQVPVVHQETGVRDVVYVQPHGKVRLPPGFDIAPHVKNKRLIITGRPAAGMPSTETVEHQAAALAYAKAKIETETPKEDA